MTTNLTSSHAGRTKNSKNGTGRKRQAATSATVNRTRVEIGLFGRTAFKGDIPEASMEGVLQALIDLEVGDGHWGGWPHWLVLEVASDFHPICLAL